MVVQHNIQAMNASRMLNVTADQQSKSTEKLSSGYRINRAADDAAGLSISEKMRKQIKGLDQASTNAQDGVSAVQTAEGALTEVHSMLQRMNELAVQASNGTNSRTDRESIQSEIDQLTTEIDRVAETTKFNETYLLGGDKTQAQKPVTLQAHDAGIAGKMQAYTDEAQVVFTANAVSVGDKVTIGGKQYEIAATKDEANGKITVDGAYSKMLQELKVANGVGTSTVEGTVDQDGTTKNKFTITRATQTVNRAIDFSLHVGADADMTNKINVKIEQMNSKNLGVDGLRVVPKVGDSDYDTDAGSRATYAIDAIADAISKVSEQRSSLGAIQNRLEHTIANVDNVVENSTAAESRIRDTDMADEMVRFSKNNILAQAGQSMLAQANQSTQGVLSILG